MRTVFQAELQQIGDELVHIATLVQEAMANAADSFLIADVAEAEDVISNDARIDLLQNQLDERAIDVLALQGPVASDLRMIVGGLRMSSSLERMGDLARHVAQIARMRYPEVAVPDAVAPIFKELAEADTRIIAHVIELLKTRELTHADEIYAEKAKVNELHRSVFAAMAADDWKETAQVTVDITLASRYFERFADHGVSVARKVTYLVTGEWV